MVTRIALSGASVMKLEQKRLQYIDGLGCQFAIVPARIAWALGFQCPCENHEARLRIAVHRAPWTVAEQFWSILAAPFGA